MLTREDIQEILRTEEARIETEGWDQPHKFFVLHPDGTIDIDPFPSIPGMSPQDFLEFLAYIEIPLPVENVQGIGVVAESWNYKFDNDDDMTVEEFKRRRDAGELEKFESRIVIYLDQRDFWVSATRTRGEDLTFMSEEEPIFGDIPIAMYKVVFHKELPVPDNTAAQRMFGATEAQQ